MMKTSIVALLYMLGASIAFTLTPHASPPPIVSHLRVLPAAGDDALPVIAIISHDSIRTDSNPARKTPLKDALTTLQPKAVWENFCALTRIPRSSQHEQQISRFLANFGRNLDLETVVDSVGNVLIRKPAAMAMEQRQGVALQAHMDMVAQKTPDNMFNFEKDPIEAFLEDGWVRADRTSLGADNGIGVAMAMAILQAKGSYGPIEALFTVDEEADGTGVGALKPGVLKSHVLINLDSESEGTFIIGSAGGVYVNSNATYRECRTPMGMAAFRLRVMGLQGGHSGSDIHRGRGNAGRLLARLLVTLGSKFGVRVAQVTGGDQYSVIPREAAAHIVIPANQTNLLVKYIQEFERTLLVEFGVKEPNLSVRAYPAALPTVVMDSRAQRDLIGTVHDIPNGVIRMSDIISGLVETSCSMGILKAENGRFSMGIYVRSAVDSSRDDLAERLLTRFQLARMESAATNAYSGWRPNPKSAILRLMKQLYHARFGADPVVTALHAGLETGEIGVKYPEMDMISIGPTIVDVHSPHERVEVLSVQKVYDLLIETLKRIPERQ